MNNIVHLDLVVLGSVLASRDGKRIACGNRITDVSFGYLLELGFITSKTKIVTLVHDCQVRDIPDIMKAYDIPVDFIITPTEVIEVENPPARPNGILWEIIPLRTYRNSKILHILKKKKEDAGEIVQLRPPTKAHTETIKLQNRRRAKMEKSKNTNETSEFSEGNPENVHQTGNGRNRRIRNVRRLGRKVRMYTKMKYKKKTNLLIIARLTSMIKWPTILRKELSHVSMVIV